MDRFELQKLRDLPIEGVAERLGLHPNRQHKCLCPFHDDHHASLSFCSRNNTCRCFVCMDSSMGTIDLVMRHLRMDFREACRWLASENSIVLSEDRVKAPGSRWGAPDARRQADGLRADAPDAPGRTNMTDARANADAPGSRADALGRSNMADATGRPPFNAARYERFFLQPSLSAEARRFLFEERRLDARVIRWCGVSSWCDRNGTPWLQTPYFDTEGRLIGIQNRNLMPKEGEPRFRFPYGSQCSCYNLPVVRRLKEGDELWITEGCSDCWAMLSAGHKAIAIPSATLLSPLDKQLLTGLSERLHLAFHMYPDKDAPGERLFLQLKELLPNLEHHHLPPGCKDFADFYVAQKIRTEDGSAGLPKIRTESGLAGLPKESGGRTEEIRN